VEERHSDLGVAASVDDLPEDVVVHGVREGGRHDEAAHRDAAVASHVDELFPGIDFVNSFGRNYKNYFRKFQPKIIFQKKGLTPQQKD
jgi:hypothetical protein